MVNWIKLVRQVSAYGREFLSVFGFLSWFKKKKNKNKKRKKKERNYGYAKV